MNRISRSSRRARRSFRLEQLEARQMLVAPEAFDDTFNVNEDSSITTGLSTSLSAQFESTAGGFPLQSSWSFLDRIQNVNGTLQTYPTDGASRAWNHQDFDTTTSTIGPWGAGTAPLQAGGVDLFPGAPTTLDGIADASNGQNLITTYLFRRTFALTAAQAAATTGTARVFCDDGCIGYLNGVEVFRQNIAAGAVNTETLAANGDETQYATVNLTNLAAAGMVAGSNTFAVEVHQTTLTSSDVGFEMELTLGGGNADGFTYLDDTFGTARPTSASGDLQPTGGFNATGGVHVRVGAGEGNGIASSGGWSRTFTVPSAGTVAVTTRYRLLAAGGYENTEYSQAVLTIDGTRYGIAAAAGRPGPILREFTGDGNNGPAMDSGWQITTLNIPLTAGNHTLVLGGYNNQSTTNDETTDIWFDDVTIITPGGQGGVLSNDIDQDPGDVLTAVIASQPLHGTLNFIGATGNFTYTPDLNYNGPDSFTYRAHDGSATSNLATVNLNVVSINDAPVAANNAYNVAVGQSLTVPAATGILANDTDVDTASRTAVLVTNVSTGTLVLSPDGSFVYTPSPTFSGVATFTYQADDGQAANRLSNVATVSITVNGRPTANPDGYTLPENGSLTITLAGNEPPAQVFFSDFNAGTPAGISGAGAPESVQNYDGLGPNGNTFGGNLFRNTTDNGGGNGPAGITTLTLTNLPAHTHLDLNFLLAIIDSWDGNSGGFNVQYPDLFNVTVDGATIFSETFDTPNFADQSYSPSIPAILLRDGVQSGFNTQGGNSVDSAYDMSLEPRFHDIPHTAATVTVQFFASGQGWSGATNSVESWGIDNLRVFVKNRPNSTSSLVTAGSSWRYLDNGSDQGTAWIAPNFNDAAWASGPGQLGYGDGDEATVVGFGPDANNKFVTTYFRRQFTANNVASISALLLEVIRDDGVAIYLNGTEIVRDNLASGAAFNTLANISVADETTWLPFNISPSLLVEGTNTLAIEMHQSALDSSDLSLDLRLTATGSVDAGVLANDVDPEGALLTAERLTNPANGALTFNANGTFTYTPNVNYFGMDTFTYRAFDGTVHSDPTTVTFTITPGPNDVPIAVADAYNATEDTPLFVEAESGVLVNDTDGNNDPLVAQLISTTANGALTLNMDGSFTYVPNADFFGTDSFRYRAYDGSDTSAFATVTLTVAATNDIPTAVNDQYFTPRGVQLVVAAAQGVTANDLNPDQQTLTAAHVGGPANGTLQLNANGSFTYTPNQFFSGTDSFTYRVSDLNGTSGLGTVSITINGAPVANADNYSLAEDGQLTTSLLNGVLANDVDPDDDPMTAQLVTGPQHGTLTLNPNGTFTYTPANNYAGPDTFTYRANDARQSSAPATVTIDISPINDPPIGAGDAYSVTVNQTLNVAVAQGVLANDTDVDNPTLTATLVNNAGFGVVVLNANGSFTYTPDVDYIGSDSFSYRASDGQFTSAITTVTLTVNPASQNVIVTEIMYHPSSENDAEEYVELYNNGTSPVNVAGWQFTRGVTFVIPNVPQAQLAPGGYLVVAANQAAFAAKYPTVTNVVSGWVGSLSNRGEDIELSDALGGRIDLVEYWDEGDWAVRVRTPVNNNHQGWDWLANHDGLGSSLELINPGQTNNQGQNWSSSTTTQGTPGRVNSVLDADIAPLIRRFDHTPAVPTATQSVTVTAEFDDELDTGVVGTLFWRLSTANPGAFQSVPMFDDGLHGDGQAGDRLFGATIPATNQDQAVVEFYVRAVDAGNNVRTWPAPNSAVGQSPNALYQVDNAQPTFVPGSQPIYRLIMTVPDDTEFDGVNRNTTSDFNVTFIAQTGHGDIVKHLSTVRPRGASSRTRNPISMRLSFPSDDQFNGVTDLNLNSQYTYLQTLGAALFKMANLPGFDAQGIQLRRNGVNEAGTGNVQFGSYAHVEVSNSQWANAHLPDDDEGNVYSKRRPDNKWDAHPLLGGGVVDVASYQADGWDKESNQTVNDWLDIDTFLKAMNNTPAGPGYFNTVNAVANVDQFVRYFALMTIMNSRETSVHNGEDDDYDMYRGVLDPRFMLLPHDLDTIFGLGDTGSSATAGLFPAIDGSGPNGQTMPPLVNFFHDPTVARMYWAVLKEYSETILTPAIFGPLVDNLLTGWAPQATRDSIKTYADQRRLFILSQVPPALTVAHNLTPQNGFPRTTNPATVTLSGAADVSRVAKVLVGGVAANWDPFARTWTTAAGAGGATTTLLPVNSTWRYLDNGSDQGTTWRDPGFNDSSWLAGPAELGYGDGGEATVVACGPVQACNASNFPTTYFRHTFNVADTSQLASLRVRVRRDDGVAIYLNGNEIVRDNLAAGALFADFAPTTASDDGATFLVFDIAGLAGLQNGPNTLAVEIHQQSATSSDISFDMELLGVLAGTTTGVQLSPGINRVLVQALDAADVELSRSTLDIWYDDSTETTVGAQTISANTTWTAANGPYRVTGNVTVAAGATLTIEPGTSVYFNPGVGITVNGRLLAEGTDTRHIRLRAPIGSTTPWAGIQFVNASNPALESRLAYVDMENGDSRGNSIAANNSVLSLDHLTWVSAASQILELTASSFRVANSTFPGIAAGGTDGELIHGNGIMVGGRAILEGNTFGVTNGYNDVIDFSGGKRPNPILQILNNTFTGGSDDALDLDGTDAHIEGNIFRGFHKNNTSDSSSNAIATGLDGGNNSVLYIARNFFYDNDHALLLKEGSSAVFENNTVVNSTIGAINFDEPNRPVNPGQGITIESSIFVGNALTLENAYVNDPVNGTVVVTLDRSVVPAADVSRGAGNRTGDPRLASVATSDYSLRPGSVAKNAGRNGLDIGATAPGWASIAGEPMPMTSATAVPLTVYGPGITHYRYSLDGAAFGAETTVGTPITLAGLAAGAHSVRIIAKNSAGVWQTEAAATTSRSWTVAAGHVDVRINEVLAVNEGSVVHEGTRPDIIELYNYGSTTVDLSGFGLTDEILVPGKFTFPANSLLPAGGYLRLFANLPDGTTGTHLGFSLDRNGETLTLLNSGLPGGTIVDQMSFGMQIPNFSVGRSAAGDWTLNVPTLGAANVGQPTGNPATLKINEWLADGQRLFRDDRLELYNPDVLPVSLAGLRLTDNPVGKPDKHAIAPLSFVAGSGFGVLVPDENSSAGADHLNFRLDTAQEFLGLLDSSLKRIDVVLYMPQTTDISQGRNIDGQAPYQFLSPPNIGFPNNTVFSVNALLDNLRVTELQYNPVGGTNFEFVELKNISTTLTLDLTGVRFTNGLDFEFPAMTLAPGQYAVIVRNLASFQSRYGTGIPVAGVFGGALDNSGENIELALPQPFDGTIQDFSFDDAWYPVTDGGGPSLVIRDPLAANATWDFAAAWRASGLAFGSPGSDDPLDGGPPQVTQVLVRGSDWTGSFLTKLELSGLGMGAYAVPTMPSLIWSNIDQIVVDFNEPILASQGQFSLRGINVPNYATTNFAVDGNRATWTLAAPISVDKLLLTLPGSITDGAGNPLAGGAYSFRFNVHPGDVNVDTAVNRADLVANLVHQFSETNTASYDPLHDVDGNGKINIADWVWIRNRFGTTLPPGEPSSPPPSPPAAMTAGVRGQGSGVRDSSATDVAITTLRSSARRTVANTRPTTPPPATPVEPLAARRLRATRSSRAHDAAFEQM